jgi:hypothetical protein
MTTTNTQKSPDPLRLNLSSVNLAITPEQFDRLCIDNPDLHLELTPERQLTIFPTNEESSPVSHQMTPEEIALKALAVERFVANKRQLWDSLTPEEKVENDEQFAALYKSLEESRR